ncbi:MAG TPA: hypothetical protein VJK09_03335 [Candidatus Paceibacterota bacterium]
MINLLSQEGRIVLRREYHKRIVCVGLAFLVTLESLGILFLSLSAFSVWTRTDAVGQVLKEAEARPVSREADQMTRTVKETNNKIKLLETGTSKHIHFTEIIKIILAQKSPEMSLAYIEMTKDNRIKLRGIALTRASLLNFVRGLNKESVFAEVISPISNLISSTDIDFSVDLILSSTSTNVK